MSRPSERTLYLDHEKRLGEKIDDDAFEVFWEFWFRCTLLLPALEDESMVSDEDAGNLAGIIERGWDDLAWQIDRFLWADFDGAVTRQFIRFLRRGGFVVVDLSQSSGG